MTFSSAKAKASDEQLAAKSKELEAVSADLKKWSQAAKLLKNKNKELEALVKSLTEANAKREQTAGDSEVEDVPDPYYGDTADFDYALDLIEDACSNLLNE